MAINQLSVAIISLNEERIIDHTLASVADIADEIILVDSGSTDKTLEIAESFGATIYNEKWRGYSEQKNFAISKCTCKWILSLDSDEMLPKPLVDEIMRVINWDGDIDGYKIARELYIGNRLIKNGGYYPDYQLRLFKRDSGAKFAKREVHESVALNGKVSKLRNPLKHYAYMDLDQYREALKKYAKLASKEIKKEKANMPILRAIWAFIYRYIFRLGFVEGKVGLDMNKAYSGYVYEKYSLASQNN